MALSPRTLPRPISRRAEADQSARPLQALIALFTKILLEVSAQTESEQMGDTKDDYPCSGGRAARKILRSRHGCLYSYFSSSSISAKALTANSKSSRECAAETCVRTRAVPIGTTG